MAGPGCPNVKIVALVYNKRVYKRQVTIADAVKVAGAAAAAGARQRKPCKAVFRLLPQDGADDFIFVGPVKFY